MEMSQEHYIDTLVDRFRVGRERPVRKLPALHSIDLSIKDQAEIDKNLPYREIIGGLLYISNYTRPDISSAMSILSKFLDKPTRKVWGYAKQVLSYLLNTKWKRLILGNTDGSNLVAYADSNFAPLPDRKSQSGAVFKLDGSTIGWFSRKQKTVSTCTAEAESIALSMALNQVKWMQQLLDELGYNVKYPTMMYEDNQPAIYVATNQKNTQVAKHIDIKYHDVQDCQLKYLIDVKYISTKDQLADALTKVPSNPQMIDAILGSLPGSTGRNRGVCCTGEIPASVPTPNKALGVFESGTRRHKSRTFWAKSWSIKEGVGD